MLIAVFVALASAASYGVSDFYGGISSARLRVAPTSLIGYGCAAVTALVALMFVGGDWSLGAVGWGALAGVLSITGTLLFYAALIAGPISIGAPIVGTTESAIPVIAGVLFGQQMPGLAWLAIVLAAAGGVLVSLRWGPAGTMTARAGVLAVAGGVLFGCSILALDRAPHGAGLIPAVFIGVVGFAVMAALLGTARLSGRVRRVLNLLDGMGGTDGMDGMGGTDGMGRTDGTGGTDSTDAGGAGSTQGSPGRGIRHALPAVVAGVLLGGGNVLLVLALRAGPLAVVAVLSDLYPVAAVLLAWFVARERLSLMQFAGVALAIGSSVLFALA
ncbi:EamA family transporter [Gryllotalpicola reticulitermitis]|uniref:EamA family transporter n=1 Tax=Gryllotalpicola reticulitermitis TaxID=1184153 RepID=A0ABV8QAG4_9MICO